MIKNIFNNVFFTVPFNIHMRSGVISVAREIEDNELLAYTVKVISLLLLIPKNLETINTTDYSVLLTIQIEELLSFPN